MESDSELPPRSMEDRRRMLAECRDARAVDALQVNSRKWGCLRGKGPECVHRDSNDHRQHDGRPHSDEHLDDSLDHFVAPDSAR
jgi:hypothetical protein